MDMTEDDPRWRAAAAAKASEGAALMRRYGAHGLGVAWVDVGAGQQPGLVLVVAAAPAAAPAHVQVHIDGRRYTVPVTVEIAPPDQLEATEAR